MKAFEYNDEQKRVINSRGDIKVDACAGSGKTLTIGEICRQNQDKKILYLTFSNTTKDAAIRLFNDLKLVNVTCKTFHSIAITELKKAKLNYQLEKEDLNNVNISQELRIKNIDNIDNSAYLVASLVKDWMSAFLNSDIRQVTDCDFLSTMNVGEKRNFARKHYDIIVGHVRELLKRMHTGKMPVVYDFFLKMFQLGDYQLGYDIIVLDEAQDASPVICDVIIRQKARKIIMGDRHQSIYGFRHAIDSLDCFPFETYTYSSSYRFDQYIADMANYYLSWKEKHLGNKVDVNILGEGTIDPNQVLSSAYISKTNIGLLRRAFDVITDKSSEIEAIYFEGNINNLIAPRSGGSIFDVYSLWRGRRDNINDNLIMGMPSFVALRDYVEISEDAHLRALVDIVDVFKDEIVPNVKKMKSLSVKKEDKKHADIIFSTVHKAKGLEYSDVTLDSEFMNEEQLTKAVSAAGPNKNRLKEEVNQLYIAVTRTQRKVNIPMSLVPEHLINGRPKKYADLF